MARILLSALAPMLIAGCAFLRPATSSPSEVSARVLIPADLNVNLSETVVKPGALGPPTAPAGPVLGFEPQTFALAEAIAFGLRNNPRYRSARAAVERARGQEQAAFAPFLPQLDFFGQAGGTSSNLGPGTPGYAGFLRAINDEPHSYQEIEVALQWTLYDFGRTGGRYRQAVARERITELRLSRAGQAVEFDVASAYFDVLLARASRRVQEDAVRRARSVLDDAEARRQGGVVLKEDVLRAEVQLSESREALVLAREGEFNAVARMNNAMGRNAALPLEVFDLEVRPPLPGSLADLLEQAAAQRPEVGVAQQVVAGAEGAKQAARGDFLPRIYVQASVGNTTGQNVETGLQGGAGLHIQAPLYAGGRHRGDLHSAEADIEAALADAQFILDAISLQVNLAYRGAVASWERIDLARTAVVQAEENVRLVRVRYRNGNATPTDVVDSEAALTRSQQRFFSATYTYVAALARLDYAVGQHQGACLRRASDGKEEQKLVPDTLPVPRVLPKVR